MFSANAKKDLHAGSGEVLVFQASAPIKLRRRRALSPRSL
jgi:hypothetical protein